MDVRTKGASHWIILASLFIAIGIYGAGFWSGTQIALKRIAEANAEKIIFQDKSNREARQQLKVAQLEKRKQVDESKQVFNQAIETDDAFKDWTNVPLPCVARHLAVGRLREARECGSHRRRT